MLSYETSLITFWTDFVQVLEKCKIVHLFGSFRICYNTQLLLKFCLAQLKLCHGKFWLQFSRSNTLMNSAINMAIAEHAEGSYETKLFKSVEQP